jgi:hypothetical protein
MSGTLQKVKRQQSEIAILKKEISTLNARVEE